MRILFPLLFALLPLAASAQQQDSYFKDYQDYERFVDSRLMTREFVELIQVLGGRDEYTVQQLNSINRQFLSLYSVDFTNRGVARKTDLGDGFSQEMRIYWDEDAGYIFFYALLHARPDALVVLAFSLNSDVAKVLAKF